MLTLKQINRLTKTELLNVLPNSKKTKKVEKLLRDSLVDVVMDYLGDSKIKHNKLIKEYNKRFSYHPSDLEELLNITKTERLRWTEEKKLIVSYYDSFHKWGQTITYPMYDYISTHKLLNSGKIECWRREHKEKVTKNRKLAAKKTAKKAQKTRLKNKSLMREFYDNEWPSLLKKWYQEDPVIGATLQLGFWTMWVNRYAKEMQEKERNARKNRIDYLNAKDFFYDLKEEGIKALMQSPIAKIEFYEPNNPDKISNLQFCPFHYEMWCMERQWDYIPKWDYFHMNKKDITSCPDCSMSVTKDYYSLFYLSVSSGDVEFSFHTPYPLGVHLFPEKSKLKKVKHQEQEGLFRFGRSLFEDEKVIFKESYIKKYFSEAIDNFQEQINLVNC